MKIFSLRVMASALGAVLLFAATAMADVPQTVPEPATMSMLAAGAGMYLLHRRRRRK
ncbi:MAG TPA: PEP-CTERM sorting domain-containing protein [Vicinamibacterales bacterium]|jgi:hypothetical protein|nr:PEP-CTERM sorting domain-containing protein [Vicinamibacterales bacterium]